MATLRSNLRDSLVENYNSSMQETLFVEWVVLNSQNDPDFFRFAFQEDFEKDFDSSMSDAQQEEWSEFVSSLEELSYDIQFNDETDSNNKGFSISMSEAKNWIEANKSDETTYFGDYKGGTVSIICNETGSVIFEENI